MELFKTGNPVFSKVFKMLAARVGFEAAHTAEKGAPMLAVS
jgi:hypothetical protein